jgi:ribosomal protein S19E (S16A)
MKSHRQGSGESAGGMMKVHVTRNIVFVLLGCCALVAMATPLKELSAFVKAYVAYQNIRASYGPALERANDAQQKKRIEQEANTKVKQSLDAQGLTSERYNHIFATVNGNEELRKKVLKKVEDERRKS